MAWPIRLSRGTGDIREGAIAVVAIQPGERALRWHAEVIGGDVPDVVDAVARRVEILPAVVVEIEEPGGKAEDGLLDTCLGGDVREPPMVGGRAGAGGTVVVEQDVWAGATGEVEVGTTVVVVIGAGDALDEGPHAQTHGLGAFGEGTVAVVAEQFAGIGISGIGGFVSDEEVEPSVAVEVEPAGGLGGMEREEARLLGDIGEGAVAVVPQEGIGDAPELHEPGAPQDPDVGAAVVVVVGLHQVEAAVESDESGLAGAFLETSGACVAEEAQRTVETPAGSDDVEQAVVVEVLDDGTAAEVIDIDARRPGDVRESRHRVFGSEARGWDEPLGRDLVGVLAHGHVGDVEEPAGGKVVGELLQLFLKNGEGTAGTAREDVEGGGGQRKEAGFRAVPGNAVLLFAHAEEGDGLAHAELGTAGGRHVDAVGDDRLHGRVGVEGGIGSSGLRLMESELDAGLEALDGIGGLVPGLLEDGGVDVAAEEERVGVVVVAERSQAFRHAAIRGRWIAGIQGGVGLERREAEWIELVEVRDALLGEGGNGGEQEDEEEEPRRDPGPRTRDRA